MRGSHIDQTFEVKQTIQHIVMDVKMWQYLQNSAFLYALLSRDVLLYDDVCPGLRPGFRISVRLSVIVSVFFSYIVWHIEVKFYMSLSSYEHSIKLELCQFPLMFVEVVSLLELKVQEIHRFPLCFLTYLALILHMILFYCTSEQIWVSSIGVNFSGSYAPFWTWYWKYTVFSTSTFLLHALTYWAGMLHMTLFYCTTDQVRVLLICINFCMS